MSEVTLTKEQLKALRDLGAIPPDSAYVPTSEGRYHFESLVKLGLAVSRGPGLGGEGFAPTPEGREVLASKKYKSRRGFAGMSPERRREIARMGGANVPAEKRSFSMNRELASRAGVKGGEVSGPRRKPEPREE